MVDQIPLPKGVKKTDLKYKSYPKTFWNWSDEKQDEWRNKPANQALVHPESKNNSFELWEIQGRNEKFWVIPTLEISRTRGNLRTYATRVDKDDALMSVGNGPHVLSKVRVYCHKNREKDLMPYLDKHHEGMIRANQYRDQLSTRRANTRARRSMW
jgi:hypothetical protein